jgi:hypothetical protein
MNDFARILAVCRARIITILTLHMGAIVPHLYGWPPKLAACYFNMNSNNAYKVYVCLHTKHHRGRDPMPLRECINNLTHPFLQQGLDMRQRGYGAPPSATKDISTSSSGEGRSI